MLHSSELRTRRGAGGVDFGVQIHGCTIRYAFRGATRFRGANLTRESNEPNATFANALSHLLGAHRQRPNRGFDIATFEPNTDSAKAATLGLCTVHVAAHAPGHSLVRFSQGSGGRPQPCARADTRLDDGHTLCFPIDRSSRQEASSQASTSPHHVKKEIFNTRI